MDRNSEKVRYGHLRHRERNKPVVECPKVRFYYCETCGNMLSSMNDSPSVPWCCQKEMTELTPKSPEEFEPEVKVDYLIFGSLNENAIKASWECEDWKEKPEWIWLHTFTGGQLKYISSRRRSPIIFGLAGTDAYAYCDKDPCVECTFRCKRGFGLYFYFKNRGLIHLPFERMCARQQTKNRGVSLNEILRREGRLKE